MQFCKQKSEPPRTTFNVQVQISDMIYINIYISWASGWHVIQSAFGTNCRNCSLTAKNIQRMQKIQMKKKKNIWKRIPFYYSIRMVMYDNTLGDHKGPMTSLNACADSRITSRKREKETEREIATKMMCVMRFQYQYRICLATRAIVVYIWVADRRETQTELHKPFWLLLSNSKLWRAYGSIQFGSDRAERSAAASVAEAIELQNSSRIADIIDVINISW